MERIDQIRATIADVEPASCDWTSLERQDNAERGDLRLRSGERFAANLTRDEVENTKRKVERIVRKCARYGLPAPTVTTRYNDDETFDLLIQGLGIKVGGGWRVVAVIDHAGDGMAVTAPGAPEGTFQRWNNAPAKCDECGRNLRRSMTVVVRNEDGEEKQIGGQCATTFLGMSCEVAMTWEKEERDLDALISGRPVVSVQHVLSVARAVTRVIGWRSRQKASEEGGPCSADLVVDVMFGRGQRDAELRRLIEAEYDVTSEQHIAYMRSLNEWAATAGGSDYLDSIRFAVCERDSVSVKRVGLLASVPQAYDRAVQERLEAERSANEPAVEVPVTSERITIAGTVQRVKHVDSDYGLQVKMLVATDEGYRVWGTCPAALGDVEAGDRVQFAAKIERSRDDVTFGFYSRPTKAVLIPAA
jgi:hypothetical protein